MIQTRGNLTFSFFKFSTDLMTECGKRRSGPRRRPSSSKVFIFTVNQTTVTFHKLSTRFLSDSDDSLSVYILIPVCTPVSGPVAAQPRASRVEKEENETDLPGAIARFGEFTYKSLRINEGDGTDSEFSRSCRRYFQFAWFANQNMTRKT